MCKKQRNLNDPEPHGRATNVRVGFIGRENGSHPHLGALALNHEMHTDETSGSARKVIDGNMSVEIVNSGRRTMLAQVAGAGNGDHFERAEPARDE